jgi:cell shape-determining protein MreC
MVKELQDEKAVLRERIRKALQDWEELEMLQKESHRLREEIDVYRKQKEGISETGKIV